MTTLTIILIVIATLAVLMLVVHTFYAAWRREKLIRYYEDRQNERLERELQEAREQWDRDSELMREELNQLKEKNLEYFKNFKDIIDKVSK